MVFSLGPFGSICKISRFVSMFQRISEYEGKEENAVLLVCQNTGK